jgi:hypothetical protein
MEKKKLKLNDLKVQSFVTELDKDSGQTLNVQGGTAIKGLGFADWARHESVQKTYCTCVTRPC